MSESFLILRRIQQGIINSHKYLCKVPVILLINLEFSRQIFEKNTLISNFMTLGQVGTDLFHKDGRTDMTKLKFLFGNFANASKTFIESHGLSG